jgi:hypothetical protein
MMAPGLAVAGRAAQQLQRGDDQCVDGDDPLRMRGGGRQVGANRGDREVGDGEFNPGDHRTQATGR